MGLWASLSVGATMKMLWSLVKQVSDPEGKFTSKVHVIFIIKSADLSLILQSSMVPLNKRHYTTVITVFCLLREFCGVCICCNAIQMCCKKIKISIITGEKVLDPNRWRISKVFASCLCCNIHHLVDPVITAKGCIRTWEHLRFSDLQENMLCSLRLRSRQPDNGRTQKPCKLCTPLWYGWVSDMLLSDVVYTHARHLHSISGEGLLNLCISMLRNIPQWISNMAHDTYLMRVSSSLVLYPAVCRIYPSFPIRAATIKSWQSSKQVVIRVKVATTSLAIHE